jgi:hypothetical protein
MGKRLEDIPYPVVYYEKLRRGGAYAIVSDHTKRGNPEKPRA